MSMQIDFSSLTKKLSELEKKVQNKVSKEALEAGGDIMLNTQKQTVSVDTGALKASLSKGKESELKLVLWEVQKNKKDTATMLIMVVGVKLVRSGYKKHGKKAKRSP